jgi:hypothetical protein
MHVGGHIRKTFEDQVVPIWSFGERKITDETLVGLDNYDEGQVSFSRLVSDLRGCTDIMPRMLCEDLGLEQGSTYDEGLRVVLGEAEAA